MIALSRFPRLPGKAHSKILHEHRSFRNIFHHYSQPGEQSVCRLSKKLMCQQVSSTFFHVADTCRLSSSQFLPRFHSVADIQHDLWGIDQHVAHLKRKLPLNQKRFQDLNYLQMTLHPG